MESTIAVNSAITQVRTKQNKKPCLQEGTKITQFTQSWIFATENLEILLTMFKGKNKPNVISDESGSLWNTNALPSKILNHADLSL